MRIFWWFILIFIFVPFAAAQPKKAYRSSTKNLPSIDKIKVYQLYRADLQGIDQSRNGERLAEKILKGREVKKVTDVWRKLEYRSGLSACHEPHYSVEFYSKGRLIVQASVCWSCNNIFFSVPKLFKNVNFENNTQNFTAEGKFSQQLLEIFKNTFIK